MFPPNLFSFLPPFHWQIFPLMHCKLFCLHVCVTKTLIFTHLQHVPYQIPWASLICFGIMCEIPLTQIYISSLNAHIVENYTSKGIYLHGICFTFTFPIKYSPGSIKLTKCLLCNDTCSTEPIVQQFCSLVRTVCENGFIIQLWKGKAPSPRRIGVTCTVPSL